ncbi:MAG: DsrE/DsrF/DrsH-like family protein [Bacteriovoracaceae bacterium]|nr:DsrE/DsrF/DrsH-like family protein [Bacteriovoracaceae bacterium]
MSTMEPVKKVTIVISKGGLEHVYPGLIMANGARMEGIEADVFFTFFGLDAIIKSRMDKLKVATVGNPGMRFPNGMAMPTMMGMVPGMSSFVTKMMQKEMDQLDIPPISEFLEMISDAGGGIYACKATVEMFHLNERDFCDQLNEVITVGEFYEKSAGAQIIFT